MSLFDIKNIGRPIDIEYENIRIGILTTSSDGNIEIDFSKYNKTEDTLYAIIEWIQKCFMLLMNNTSSIDKDRFDLTFKKIGNVLYKKITIICEKDQYVLILDAGFKTYKYPFLSHITRDEIIKNINHNTKQYLSKIQKATIYASQLFQSKPPQEEFAPLLPNGGGKKSNKRKARRKARRKTRRKTRALR